MTSLDPGPEITAIVQYIEHGSEYETYRLSIKIVKLAKDHKEERAARAKVPQGQRGPA
tara:strand:- start:684 stop:857 length:174 start_codon:yes stop_codon:yes gene_type:complete